MINQNVKKIKIDDSLLRIRLSLFFDRNFDICKNEKSMYKSCQLISHQTNNFQSKESIIEYLSDRIVDDIIKSTEIVKSAKKERKEV